MPGACPRRTVCCGAAGFHTGDIYVALVHCADCRTGKGRGTPRPQKSHTSPWVGYGRRMHRPMHNATCKRRQGRVPHFAGHDDLARRYPAPRSYDQVLPASAGAGINLIAPHLLPSHCVLHTSAPSRVRSPQLIPNHCYLITALQAPASACSLALLIPDT